MTVMLAHGSVIDREALNFPSGPFGTCINGQTFQQEALVSCRGFQYAVYFADGGVLAVARRQLPKGSWETIRFADYAIHHDDVHNVAVIGICEEDGTIHLSFDHHGHPLHYRRSVPGVALRPEEFAWEASLFGPITSVLVPGQPLKTVTYPQFVGTPQGKLQLLYRLGASGDGDWYLAEYDPTAGGWAVLGQLFSRAGQYQTSSSRCAYPNPLRYGGGSRLHVTWCWRERPREAIRDLRTNHDLCYAYSDDFGRTWCDTAGCQIAVLDAKQSGIAVDTPGTVVRTTRYLWGQMNTTTQWIDSRGRVHVINWQQQQDAAAASTDLNTWRYYHYWRDTDGTWHDNPLPFIGRKPQIAVAEPGTAHVVYCQGEDRNYHGQDHGGKLTIAVASEASGWQDWQTAWQSETTFVGEPLLDPMRWRDAGILSAYVQEKPTTAGAPSALHVIDFVTR